MGVSPIEYRHEFISGAVAVPLQGLPARILVQVSNRDDTDGRVRVLIWIGKDIVRDSQDALIEPHDLWSFEQTLAADGVDIVTVSYRVQILTNTLDLVPSVAFAETAWSDGQDEGFRESTYFAPGDFAVFTRPQGQVNRPPVGPPIEI